MDTAKTDRRLIWSILLLAICFTVWLCARISFLYSYQMPSHQTLHPNYLTFHEMSVSSDEGKQLGTINVGRMLRNTKQSLMANYDKSVQPKDLQCNYLTLDPGYSVIVSWARHVFTFMTDSYLCSVVLQFIFDGLMLFLLFATCLRWGMGASMVVTLLYAVNPTFAYNTVYPFAYFWEGMLLALAVLAVIWARRFFISKRALYGALCLIAAGVSLGFGVWVRANLMAPGLFIAVLLFLMPATRRHASIFLLAFTLLILPQVMRASSVAGHFATSTRLVWHTALHGLGHYPNPYGIFDEDIYAFDISHDKYNITYNFCDYRKHDLAIKDYYLKFAAAHPNFITRIIVSRIVTNIYYNFDETFTDSWNYTLVGLAMVGVAYALLVGGELLFAALLLLPLYLGMNIAIGMIYYIQAPYAFVTQWCLVVMAALAVPALWHGIKLLGSRWRRRQLPPAPMTRWGWWRAGLFSLCALGFTGALCLPPLHDYVFMQKAWAPAWMPPHAPALGTMKNLLAEWEKQPKRRQDEFLTYVHKYVPSSDNPQQDITLFAYQRLSELEYYDRAQKQVRSFVAAGGLAVELMSSLKDVSTSIIGWKIKDINVFDLARPGSWDGRILKVSLEPTAERAQSDYKQFAIHKLQRWNWAVTWLDDNNFQAVHIPKGCDELRQRLAIFYSGFCPATPYEDTLKK